MSLWNLVFVFVYTNLLCASLRLTLAVTEQWTWRQIFQKPLNNLTPSSSFTLLLCSGDLLTNSANILQVDTSYPTPWWVIKIKTIEQTVREADMKFSRDNNFCPKPLRTKIDQAYLLWKA